QPPSRQLPVFSTDTSTPDLYTLSLHDALPICAGPLTFEHADNGKTIATQGYIFPDRALVVLKQLAFNLLTDDHHTCGIINILSGQVPAVFQFVSRCLEVVFVDTKHTDVRIGLFGLIFCRGSPCDICAQRYHGVEVEATLKIERVLIRYRRKHLGLTAGVA